MEVPSYRQGKEEFMDIPQKKHAEMESLALPLRLLIYRNGKHKRKGKNRNPEYWEILQLKATFTLRKYLDSH